MKKRFRTLPGILALAVLTGLLLQPGGAPVDSAASLPGATQARAQASPAARPALAPPVGEPSDWVMTFQDEFSGPGLDREVWATEMGYDNRCLVTIPPPPGAETYCNRTFDYNTAWFIDNAHAIENGVLKLLVLKNDCSGDHLPDRNYAPYSCENFPFLSGMISTHGGFSQLYGYFEARIKAPAGQGFWPTFWLLPAIPPDPELSGGIFWPPEIDIMEGRSDQPHRLYMTHHYASAYPDPGSILNDWSRGGYHVQLYDGEDFTAGFHTYAVDWSPEAIVWYVDGVERARSTIFLPPGRLQPPYYNGDMNVIFTIITGGAFQDFLSPLDPDVPAALEVDYVRVYQKRSRIDYAHDFYLPYLEK